MTGTAFAILAMFCIVSEAVSKKIGTGKVPELVSKKFSTKKSRNRSGRKFGIEKGPGTVSVRFLVLSHTDINSGHLRLFTFVQTTRLAADNVR